MKKIYEILSFDDENLQHKILAGDLGLLQRWVVKGEITTANAKAKNAALWNVAGVPNSAVNPCLKKDSSFGNTQKRNRRFDYSRGKPRVVVAVDNSGALIEGWALLWNHGSSRIPGNFRKLGKGFFEAAKSLRNA